MKIISLKKLKELKTAFIIILSHYGLTKWEILRITKLLLDEIKIRVKE